MRDAEALQFSRQVLPELTEQQRTFVLSVDRFETNFGAGWVGLARKLGLEDPEQYADVNNWGAITTRDPNKGGKFPAFFMRDRFWRKYESPEAGLRNSALEILKPNVKAALAKNDGYGAVHAMAVNGYFIEPEKSTAGAQFGGSRQKQEDLYRHNVSVNYDQLIESTNQPRLLTFDKRKGGGFGDALIAFTFVGGLMAAIYAISGGEPPKVPEVHE